MGVGEGEEYGDDHGDGKEANASKSTEEIMEKTEAWKRETDLLIWIACRMMSLGNRQATVYLWNSEGALMGRSRKPAE